MRVKAIPLSARQQVNTVPFSAKEPYNSQNSPIIIDANLMHVKAIPLSARQQLKYFTIFRGKKPIINGCFVEIDP